MTRLLYYDTVEGEYLREFRARVVASGEGWVALDQTAFHVEGGGQPADTGLLRFPGGEARVVGVRHEGAIVKHAVEGTSPAPGTEVEGVVDWQRRFALMRGHTSGHLLARAVWNLLNAKCVGNQVDVGRLRVDVRPARLGPAEVKRIEDEVNQAIARDRLVSIRMMDRARLEGEVGERGLLDLAPSGEQMRAIEVQDYDLCPCSGTHVARTLEVGGVKLLKRESKGQQTDRITYQLVASPDA